MEDTQSDRRQKIFFSSVDSDVSFDGWWERSMFSVDMLVGGPNLGETLLSAKSVVLSLGGDLEFELFPYA